MLANFPAPVLAVAADAVRDLEGQDALCSLWSLFTRCKDSLQDGRRLENLSWRIWYRELSQAHPSYAPLTPDSPPPYASSSRKSASPFFAVVNGSDPEKKALAEELASSRRFPPSPTLTAEPHEDADRSPISPLRARGGAQSAASLTSDQLSYGATASIPHPASPSASGPGRPPRVGSFVGSILIDMLPNTVTLPPKPSPAFLSSSKFHTRKSSAETSAPSCSPPTPPPQIDIPEMPIVQLPSTPSSDTDTTMAFPKVVVVNPTPHPTPPMTPILRSDDNPNAPAPPQSTFLLPPSPAAALSASKIAPSAERSDAISSRPSHQPHQAQGSREPAQQQKSQPHAQLHPLSTLSPAQAPESLSRLDAGRSPGLFFLKHSPDDVSPDRESSTTSKSPSDRYEASSGGSGSSAIMMQRHAASMAAKDMAVVAPDVPLHDEPETMEEDADDNDDAVSVAASNAPSRGPSRAGGRIRKAGGGKAGIVRPAMARRAHSSRFIPPSLQRRSSTHSETAVVAKQEKEKEKEKEGRTTPRAASSSNLVANDFKAPQMKRAAQSSMQLAPKLSALTMTAPNASTTTSGPSAAKPIEPSPLAVLPPVVVAPEPPTLVETPPLSQPPPVAQPAAVDDATAQVQVQAQAPNGLQGRRVVVAQTSSEDYETTTDVEESDWASDEVEVDGDADIPVVAAAPAIVRSTSRGGRSNRLAEQFRMTRAAEREKAERARAEETRLREAALEAQRQREMFQKVPKRSYSNLNRSRSGLLSQLMNPDPTIFPPSHPYRQSRSAQDMSKMRSGLQPMTAHTSAQANGRAPQTPSGSGLQAGAVPAPSRMQTSKSAAAVPTQVNATVTVKSPLSNGIVAGVPEKPAPPRNAQAQPLDKLREKEREKAAAGGYRPKGRPTEVEMEMEESDDEDAQGQDDKIQMSESIAQQKLAALASKRAPGPKTGNTSTNHRQHATDGAGAKRATPSLAQQVAQAAMPMFAMQKATASAAQPTAGTTHTTATAVPVPQPIPMGHPYNFPVYALPMTPRTTRRQMLKTELSESLRRQLLWERQVSNQNLVGARRSSHNGALGGGVAPMTAVRSEGQVQARGQGQGQGQSQAQGQVQGQNQQRQGGGQGQTGQGEGAARSAEEESREARRRAAFARNRSWANDYHYAGW